jgi:hypothetical protein
MRISAWLEWPAVVQVTMGMASTARPVSCTRYPHHPLTLDPLAIMINTGRCCGSGSVGPETLELSALSGLFGQISYRLGGLADG